MENFNLKLENFEGPFDLLLKLIKVNKMEITDISIYDITDQYMSILREMEVLDMEIASEFLVLASALIEMKSKALLPKKKDEEEEIDMGAVLLHRLKEYEFFKEKAAILSSKYNLDDVIVTRLPMTLEEEKEIEVIIPKGFTSEKFFLLYMEVLDRQKEKQNTYALTEKKIPIDMFKVEDKMVDLKERLKEKRKFTFRDIVSESSGKSETIVIFLAVLELVRNHSIRIYQENILGELIIEEHLDE